MVLPAQSVVPQRVTLKVAGDVAHAFDLGEKLFSINAGRMSGHLGGHQLGVARKGLQGWLSSWPMAPAVSNIPFSFSFCRWCWAARFSVRSELD